jgi:Ca-activated chloride channel homolog
VRRLPVPLLLALALLAGCTGGDGGEEPPADPAGTLRVLAGSELRDVEPLLGQIRDATGVNLKFEYSGTLEGAERITAGGSTGPELAWFSSARYLTLLSAGAGQGRPVATERIMLSPVALGVKRSVATRFGWAGSRGLAAGRLVAHGPRKSRTTRLNSSGASMLQACPTPGRTTSLDPGMAACRSSATASGARRSWSP